MGPVALCHPPGSPRIILYLISLHMLAPNLGPKFMFMEAAAGCRLLPARPGGESPVCCRALPIQITLASSWTLQCINFFLSLLTPFPSWMLWEEGGESGKLPLLHNGSGGLVAQRTWDGCKHLSLRGAELLGGSLHVTPVYYL